MEAIPAIEPLPQTVIAELERLNVPTNEFGQLMIDKVGDVNESLRMADKVIQDLVLNKPVAAHDVMLAMQQARSELRMAVEVRNKLLESYQEIMRMQV